MGVTAIRVIFKTEKRPAVKTPKWHTSCGAYVYAAFGCVCFLTRSSSDCI